MAERNGAGVRAREHGGALLVVGGATIMGLLVRDRVQVIDVVMLYMLAVVIVAARSPRGPALLSAVLGVALFDFLFVPPFYTLHVTDTEYYLTFVLMFAVALTMGGLTGRVREQAEEAREQAARVEALYDLDRELAKTDRVADVLSIATAHFGRAVGGQAVVQLVPEGTEPAWPEHGVFEDVSVRAAATMALKDGLAAGATTARAGDADALVVPLRRPNRILGIAAVWREPGGSALSAVESHTVESLADLVASAVERADLAEQHERARLDAEAEHLRTSLLSSLSHDLRTPLGTIEGAASTLCEDRGELPTEVRHELAETIQEESRRMGRLVGNLLDMVRVETGALAVHREWQPLEESLGVALLRLDQRLAAHDVETDLPGDLPLVPIDEVLMEQVFINLLENAAKHTPPGTAVRVRAWAEGDAVIVEVADRGPGIAPADRDQVFKKFYRAGAAVDTSPAGGTGLGLTICRGIIGAHGGRIWIEETPGGGASVRFTIPLTGVRPGAVLAAGGDPRQEK